jgi:hypothetical protein
MAQAPCEAADPQPSGQASDNRGSKRRRIEAPEQKDEEKPQPLLPLTKGVRLVFDAVTKDFSTKEFSTQLEDFSKKKKAYQNLATLNDAHQIPKAFEVRTPTLPSELSTSKAGNALTFAERITNLRTQFQQDLMQVMLEARNHANLDAPSAQQPSARLVDSKMEEYSRILTSLTPDDAATLKQHLLHFYHEELHAVEIERGLRDLRLATRQAEKDKKEKEKQLNALKDPEPTLAATVQVAVQNPLQAMVSSSPSSSSSSSSATAPQAAPANPPVGGGKRGKQKSKKKKVSFA